jgi:hypothetical protein
LDKQGIAFPVEESHFNGLIEQFLKKYPKHEANIGFRFGRVIFTMITAKTPVFEWMPSSAKSPEDWQEWVDYQISIAPTSMKSMIQTSPAWSEIPTEKALVRGAFQGIIISIIFSLIITLIVTKNIIITFVAIWCVTVIILSITTFMQWNGQQLGQDESIAVVMLIGFSVDYVLHLSTDYMHSAAKSRFDKMR